MKVSLNAIKQFTDIDVSVDELVAKIGAQLGEVEGVTDLSPKYQGAIIVKVVECNDHPNADRLHVCKIDDGGVVEGVERDEQGLVQVVCGAPNVSAGVTVVWLPPGATVPESYDKDPFVLEARELRGVVSNGMLASPKELAFGDSHEGLLLLDDDKQPGQSFAEAYGLQDTIIEIENKMFTHRPDLFGLLGVARELAGIQHKAFSSPDWYGKLPDHVGEGLDLRVENEIPELVPRFMSVAIKNVEIKPSPLWLQAELIRIGAKPINNIVDVTNYIMLLTAQPTHAYDYDKLRGHTLAARLAKPGEKVELLNHKTYELDPNDIVIADGEGVVGLAGIMGGGNSEVSDTTKNIVLEVGTFDMYAVRRSSMRHGIFTDALTRFNKGQSPLQNATILRLLINSIFDVAGGELASDIHDKTTVQGREWVHTPVPVTAAFINARLGLELSATDMQTLLQNVEFRVAVDGDALVVTAPFWRTDIETREDVVEEVGRLSGFDTLPLELPQRSIAPVTKNPEFELKTAVREMLVKSGANEVLTYSFVHGNLLQKVGQDPAQAFQLSNALSPDLQYYRMSLTPSLLDKIHPNIKAGYDQFALFELGKSHHTSRADNEGLPVEDDILAFALAASEKVPVAGAAFYQAKAYLDTLADGLGVRFSYEPVTEFADQQEYKPFAANRSALVRNIDQDVIVGVIGEYTTSVRKNLKLPVYAAGFELLLSGLQTSGSEHRYEQLSRYPKLEQDMTLRVDAAVQSGDLTTFIAETLAAHKPDHTHLSLENLSIYAAEDDARHRNHSYRIRMINFERTMKADELSRLIDTVATAANQKFGAERI